MSMTRSTLLSNLNDYVKTTEAGNAELKTCMWQLTTVRRKQNRGMLTMEDHFSPDQIREDLRARTVVHNVYNKEEPSLVAEEQKTQKLAPGSATVWKLVDVLEQQDINDKENPMNSKNGNTTDSSGLRKRNKKANANRDKSSSEEETQYMTQDPIIGEEDELMKRDVLELFSGVRPTDLKAAQKTAKLALQAYVAAANRAAAILSQLELAKQTK